MVFNNAVSLRSQMCAIRRLCVEKWDRIESEVAVAHYKVIFSSRYGVISWKQRSQTLLSLQRAVLDAQYSFQVL
jgi:hypothetical protein